MLSALLMPYRRPLGTLVGCVLSYVPVVMLLAVGYAAWFARGEEPERGLAGYDVRRWPRLLFDGLIFASLIFVYALPFLVATYLAKLSFTEIGQNLSVLIIFFVTLYVTPAALVRYAQDSDLIAGFNIVAVVRAALSPRYAMTWLVWLVLFTIVIGAVLWAPDVALYGLPALSYLVLMMGASVFGWALAKGSP